MADRNQQSLVNGAPPQMAPMVPNMQQPHFAPPPQIISRNSPGPDFSQNSNQLQKPPPSMVNGQVTPTNVRNPNMQPHSGQLTNHIPNNVNDNRYSQSNSAISQNYQPSPHQTPRPNVPFQGIPTSKSYQNVQPPFSQQNAPVSDTPPGIPVNSHARPPTQSNLQYTQVPQPSPLTSRPNAEMPGISPGIQPPSSQFGSAMSQRPSYQQSNKVNATPPASQYPPTSSYPGPPLGSQMNKPISTPPTGALRPPQGPQPGVPPPINPPTSNYLPPSSISQPSPLHQGLVQQPHPSPMQMNKSITSPQFPNASQSFPLPPTQPPVQTNRLPTGIPQGYQPSPSSIGPPPRKSSNSSNYNDSVPMYNQSDSQQGTPTYQNKLTPIRPPLPNEMPSSMPRGPQQPPLTSNQLPSAGTGYGNSKYPDMNALSQNMGRMSVTQQGFNRLWGIETVDLLQCRNVLPPQKVTPPPIRLNQEFMDSVNCSPEIFCCTMNKIPETNNLLQKSRLPLGILIHPFRDLNQLAVIQCSSIVRCRACRTYINPFVYFVDNKRWKCNLCFRINELPDEFQYDPVSKTYGDPSRRPEIKSSTIEFIAPSEYMLRPPQPAIYLFVLDVSRPGCDTGYLETLCNVLLEELDNLPGDSRTQIGFILFDSCVHFFSIAENYNQAHEMIVTDIDDIFLPTPDSLLVNLSENKQLIKDLLQELPRKYAESYDTDSALGPALQAAYKLMSPIGGRITVFQSCLPNKGPGALSPREDPNQRSSKDVRHLGPQTDFYKRLSLDCSTQQISVDLFLVNSQYSDLATLGGISQFSGGCIYHFPLYRKTNLDSNEKLIRTLRRYLTRKIGFEAVMRVRCSRGLSIHTFHGNFFVRSTDLLSLPNVNPDAGFGMQVSIEDSLCELQCVCFQAAVLYTSAKGERRIRVHTLCLPVSSNLSDILNAADQQAIIGLLSKMAVDRSLKSSLSDAREAFINVAIDILSAYRLVETSGGQNTVLAPLNLSLIPLYILALLKSTAFRTGQSTRLDDRVFAMIQMKTLPLRDLIQEIHPDLYHVTQLDDQTNVEFEEKTVAQPPRLSLSSEHLDSRGAFLLDTPEVIYLLVGRNIPTEFLMNIFDVTDIRQINTEMVDLPELENDESEKLRHFINYLQAEKPWPAIVKVITEAKIWNQFLINDKAENALSYYELLHHVKGQMK